MWHYHYKHHSLRCIMYRLFYFQLHMDNIQKHMYLYKDFQLLYNHNCRANILSKEQFLMKDNNQCSQVGKLGTLMLHLTNMQHQKCILHRIVDGYYHGMLQQKHIHHKLYLCCMTSNQRCNFCISMLANQSINLIHNLHINLQH